jgi:hypothetical protein
MIRREVPLDTLTAVLICYFGCPVVRSFSLCAKRMKGEMPVHSASV